MKSWALRVTAVVLAVLALAAGGYFVFDGERQADAARAAQRERETEVARLHAVVADLRAALPGYVAAGQDPAYWARRVAELARDLETRVERLRRPGLDAATSQEIATAAEAAATLHQYDQRLRTLVDQDRLSEASRLLFSDVGSLLNAASVALSQAASLERSAADAAIAAARRRQSNALAGAAAVALVVLLLLMPPGRARPRPEAAAPETRAETADAGAVTRLFADPVELDSLGRSGFDLDLDEITPVSGEPPAAPAPAAAERPRPEVGAAAKAPASVSTAPGQPELSFAWAQAVTPANAATGADIQEAARLCTDLAQVADTEQLRQLLGRAAALLRAPGIVVWLGGVNGPSLRPAFSHGYSQQTLAHMQAIGRDDENAVSAAYRTGRLQAVAAGESGSAALVAPLLAPAGCIGAMAVEVGRGAEQDQGLRAVAQLVAAQLATLMPTDSQ